VPNLTCTISGSFRRSLDAIESKMTEFRHAGFTVLSPRNTHSVGEVMGFIMLEGETGSPKEIQQGHLNAIRRSHCLYVVNPGGYVGPSATLEIGYALSLGIPVFCLAPPNEAVICMFVKIEPDVGRVKESLADQPEETIPKRADLLTLQSYIRKMVHLRGFEKETLRDVVLLLMEEIGELAKAVRKRTGLKVAVTDGDAHKSVGVELADCLIYLLDIANLADIDLDAALRAKEAANSRKIWASDPTKPDTQESGSSPR
jgi:NTP pyrophosphatase (non-canonical NTP hydrolase)